MIQEKGSIETSIRAYKNYTGSFFNDIQTKSQVEKWGILRQFYMQEVPRIFRCGEDNLCKWIDLGAIDWQCIFSPIESIAWDLIRTRPGIVLYPQFPVFNYFIDFANPVLKIGLELDGKDFHDTNADMERDEMLLKYGWKIFRASGSLSVKDAEFGKEFTDIAYTNEVLEYINDENYKNWMQSTLTGLIEAISIYYFNKQSSEQYEDLILKTLEYSSLTGAKGIERYSLKRPF